MNDDALDAAVRRGHGSARDALSALDQVVASGDADDVRPAFDELFAAVCEERATDVLAALAVLQAAGWSASQLATEACDELRQAFLLQLAPDAADAAGSDRARLQELGAALGLPRTVRALETLGRAMVEMRDAPDPTVVLRSRSFASRAPSSTPRPPRSSSASSGSSARAPPSPRRPPPARPRPPDARGPAARVEGPGRRRGDRDVPDRDVPDRDVPDRVARTRDASGAPAGHEPTGTAPAGAVPTGPDRDALTLAWGDTILESLKPRARSLFRAGRFVEADGRSCTFAVESEAHREQAEHKRSEVEAAIASHFGTHIVLRLVVEAPSPAPEAAASTPDEEDLLAVDLAAMDAGP